MKTREQTIKAPRKVEVKTLIPWLIILVMATALSGVVAGWMLRSTMVLTNAEVRAEVLTQLAVKK